MVGMKAKKLHFTGALVTALPTPGWGRRADTTGDELAASKPVSTRLGSESLLTRFSDRQRERHSRKLRSPFVDATTSARRPSRMPIRKGRSANTRSNAVRHSDVGVASP
jgi:hypothetical protein